MLPCWQVQGLGGLPNAESDAVKKLKLRHVSGHVGRWVGMLPRRMGTALGMDMLALPYGFFLKSGKN